MTSSTNGHRRGKRERGTWVSREEARGKKLYSAVAIPEQGNAQIYFSPLPILAKEATAPGLLDQQQLLENLKSSAFSTRKRAHHFARIPILVIKDLAFRMGSDRATRKKRGAAAV
ncbi:hypothetical protein ACJRO7_007097 [Eucalyptus globulus]|uniref:Uncharacterized protein n=1 Tax=Eucalyptus globulus TaxID=34317 RepID=A0ABD3IMX3_EUCGL